MEEELFYKKNEEHLIKTKDLNGRDVYVKFKLDAFNNMKVIEHSTMDLTGYAKINPDEITKDSLKKIYKFQQMINNLSVNIITYNRLH